MRLLRAGIVLALALTLAAGCGGGEESVVVADTIDAPAAPADGLTPAESRWVADTRLDAFLGTMHRDIGSFKRTGRPHDSLVFYDERGPQYGCEPVFARGGPAPTDRLAQVRRLARDACNHLQRALEHASVFKAISPAGAGTSYQPERAAAGREARLAKAPAAKAQALLDAARAG